MLEVEEALDETPTNEVSHVEGETNEIAEISLHAIFGKPQHKTMKVQDMLNFTEVLVLVDGGSTYNFISDLLVTELKIETQTVSPFGIQIGNGDVIKYNNDSTSS